MNSADWCASVFFVCVTADWVNFRGWLMDGFGGMHPVNGAPLVARQPEFYWPGVA